MLWLSLFGMCIFLLLDLSDSLDKVCDRRPLGTKTAALPPDDQFILDIDGIRNSKYIPRRSYTVRLRAKDETSAFIGFTISLREDSQYNDQNPRKPVFLQPGTLTPNSTLAVLHPYCNNTVIQSDITAKTSVEATWTAPGTGQKCVTIFAVVAIKPNVWYSYEGPLSRQVCEDPRKDDDMPPMENDDCKVCEDARYELKFQGLWSYNTHLHQFPSKGTPAHFSDVVGAVHDSESFTLYKIGAEALGGLKMLAEQGNTTGVEIDIERELNKGVRTVIKATSPPEPHMATVTQFRASKGYTRLSIATAIVPSPDWFLGVSNMELCSVVTNQWAEKILLNLYPLDAGTDKGTDFNSANEATLPNQPISMALIGGTEKAKKPFARLILTLIRTYNTPECQIEDVTENQGEGDGDEQIYSGEDKTSHENSGEDGGDGGDGEDGEGSYEEPTQFQTHYKTTTTSEEPPSVDPNSEKDCPMTPWEEWMPCQGECIDKKITGFKIRFRYYVVDGIAIGKYVENGPSFEDKVVPQECSDKIDSQTEKCEEECEDPRMQEDEEDQ